MIGPDLRMAIFAVTGTNSRVLSEGETLNGWRLESISPKVVMLSGPAGNIVLKPQPDANLVRPPPPVAVQSGQPDPPVAGAAGQPMAVTPITVVNLSGGTPVQRLTENELSDFSRLWNDGCGVAIIEAQDVDRNHSAEV